MGIFYDKKILTGKNSSAFGGTLCFILHVVGTEFFKSLRSSAVRKFSSLLNLFYISFLQSMVLAAFDMFEFILRRSMPAGATRFVCFVYVIVGTEFF